MNYALKEANYAKLYRKEEKDQVLNLQEKWGKIVKLATLKSSTRFNMHQLREEHNKVLNASNNKGTTETIE